MNTESICTNCRGIVEVPNTVVWRDRIHAYRPLAICQQCSMGYSWHSKKNPTSGSADIYNKLTDLWFSDRPLQAMQPMVIE